jgi:hypothetical protein
MVIIAYLMELTTKPFEIQTIVSEFKMTKKKNKPFKRQHHSTHV